MVICTKNIQINRTPKPLAKVERFKRLKREKNIKYSNIKTSDKINVMNDEVATEEVHYI